MKINKDEIQLKEDYINEKYLNRNGDGYYLKVIYTVKNKRAVHIFHERHYGSMIVSYELPLSFSILDLMDYEDSFIAGPNISGGKYVGVDEKPITVKESSELSQMISEGIDCLYNTFNELAEMYKNMSK